MRASLIVVSLIRLNHSAKMPFAKDDHGVQALPSDRPDEPLRAPVLPWRPWRNRSIANTHRPYTTDEDLTVGSVSVADQKPWHLPPAIRFSQLLRDPLRVRMGGDAQPQKLSAGMLQNQKHIQQPKRDRRHDQHIHRCNGICVIAKEGLPALRRRRSPPRHVFGDAGLPDI